MRIAGIAICQATNEDVAEVLRTLKPTQSAALAAFLFDGFTQGRIAEDAKCSRTTISYRQRVAIKRLAEAGVKVPRPKRGRRPVVVSHPLDPAAVDALTTSRSEAGVLTGRWKSKGTHKANFQPAHRPERRRKPKDAAACESCGKPRLKGDRFCGKCGKVYLKQCRTRL